MLVQTPTPTSRPERQPAKKVWIHEMLGGELHIVDGSEPNTLVTARGEAHRISILGVIIGNEELPVSSVTVDDGTGQVLVRSFERKLTHPVGTVVQVIGRPRSYQGTFYVAAEAVAAVDPRWGNYRKKELGAVQEIATQKTQAPIAEQPAQGEGRVEIIMRFIQQLDDGNGAPIEQIALKSKLPNAEEIIEQLLLAGDIFELRPGRVKIL